MVTITIGNLARLGYNGREVVGMSYYHLIHPLDCAAVQRVFRSCKYCSIGHCTVYYIVCMLCTVLFSVLYARCYMHIGFN